MTRRTAGPLKVAIVDPDVAARSHLSRLLSGTVTPPTSVVLECSTTDIFVLEGVSVALDAVFADITMPGSWRLAEPGRPSLLRPELVFVASSHEYAAKAFDLEAADFLTKPFSEDRSLQTVRRLWRRCRSPRVQSRSDTLTERQTRILDLLSQGLSNKEIARALGVSHFTVRNNISLLFRLFEVSRRAELATVLGDRPSSRINQAAP
jgi:DNA-binding NarL/FixJ family response regulator